MYFPRYGPTGNHYEKINGYGEIAQSIYRVGLWFLYTVFISIPNVISKIWPRQASIMKINGYGEITQ